MDMLKKLKGFFSSEPGWQSSFFLNLFGTSSVSENELLGGLVFACIDSIASKVAMTDFYLEDKKGKIVDESPILDLIRKPNVFMTGYDFLYITTFNLILEGRALYEVEKGQLTNNPQFLVPVKASKIDIEENNLVYTLSNGEQVEGEDVLDIYKPDPKNILHGLSVLEQARLEIESDVLSLKTYKKFNQQGAIPSGILTSDMSLSLSDLDRIKVEIEKKYTGVENFFKPLVLGNGLKWQPISFDLEKLKFIESRKFTRDQILALFKVPKAVLFAEDVNRANSEAAKYWFIENTIKPYIDFIIDKLQFDLVEKIFKTDLKLGYKNPVPEDKDFQLQEDATLVNKVFTINEVRTKRGLEPIDGGDAIYLDNGTVLYAQKTKSMKKEEKKYLKSYVDFVKRKKDYTNKLIRKLSDKVGLETHLFFKNYKQGKKSVMMTTEFLVDLKEKLNDLGEKTYDILITGTEDFVDEIINNLSKYSSKFKLVNGDGLDNVKRKKINDGVESYKKTIYENVVDIIDSVRSEGEFTIDDIVNSVKEEMALDSEWRAERLVRSEIINNYNQIESEIIKNSKFPVQKMWITAKDDRVCSLCSSLDGEIIEKDEQFINSDDYEIAHPNCRCSIVPVLE
jgi:HK97 family phage portal protein